MGGADARIVRNTALVTVALVGLRLVAAAFTPITFDEAYYWMWSQNLAGDITTTRRWLPTSSAPGP